MVLQQKIWWFGLVLKLSRTLNKPHAHNDVEVGENRSSCHSSGVRQVLMCHLGAMIRPFGSVFVCFTIFTVTIHVHPASNVLGSMTAGQRLLLPSRVKGRDVVRRGMNRSARCMPCLSSGFIRLPATTDMLTIC